MGEEQNQSVRYTEIMRNLSNDSFETSSTQLLLTKNKEIKTSIRNKTLLGAAICVISVVIVLTVAIISLEKSSGRIATSKFNLTIDRLNSSTTSSTSNDTRDIDTLTNKGILSSSPTIVAKYLSSENSPKESNGKTEDSAKNDGFLTTNSISIDSITSGATTTSTLSLSSHDALGIEENNIAIATSTIETKIDDEGKLWPH